LFLVAATIFFLSLSAGADAARTEFRYYKTIDSAGLPSTGYWALTLDPEVYAHSKITLEDLRIMDEQGSVVPFLLLEDRETSTEEKFTPGIYNRGRLPGQYSNLTLDLGQSSLTNRLRLETPSRNFKRRVDLEGSPDGRGWLLLKEKAWILDFTAEQKAHLTEIHYPETSYRYLRLKIWDLEGPPIEVERVILYCRKSHTPARKALPATLLSRTWDGERRTTVCVLDLGFAHLPSDFLVVETPERNFWRNVELAGSEDQKDWTTGLRSEVYRISQGEYETEKRTLAYPEARHRYLRLSVFDLDNRPLSLSRIEVRGVEKILVWQAEPGRQFSLYYGGDGIRRPEYDLTKTAKSLDPESLPKVKSGRELLNPDYRPARRNLPWTEAHPLLFWSSLVLLVVGLGGYIVRLMSRPAR
jgi:hypothetical protein